MDELVSTSANKQFEMRLNWSRLGSSSSAAEATTGRLLVRLRGQPVWSGESPDEGLEWSWVELLEHLAENWAYLVLEDGPPLGAGLDTAPRMLAAAESLLEPESSPGGRVDRQQLEGFRSTHDLAEALQGITGSTR